MSTGCFPLRNAGAPAGHRAGCPLADTQVSEGTISGNALTRGYAVIPHGASVSAGTAGSARHLRRFSDT